MEINKENKAITIITYISLFALTWRNLFCGPDGMPIVWYRVAC